MAVSSVNGADPVKTTQVQEQKKGKSDVLASTLGLGAVGAGAGGWFGGKKPTLEQIFTQKPDSFTSNEVKEIDADAAKTLEDASLEYNNGGTKELKELRDARATRKVNIAAQVPENLDELEKKVSETKNAFEAKKVKIDDTEYTAKTVSDELTTAQEEYKNAKTAFDSAEESAKEDAKKTLDSAKEKLNKANEKVRKFYAEAEQENKTYRDAKKELAQAKRNKFENAAKVADTAEKKIVDAIEAKKTAFAEAKTHLKDEILGREEVKNAFEKIKKAFPKEGKGKAALIYGGIAAAVGLVLGLVLGGSKKEA